VEFPCQSIIVKAAWRELPDDKSVQARFFHVPAKVVDWTDSGDQILFDRTMGLVGLHIVHKTPKRQNWIWATFEHVDNTELSPDGIAPPSFNSNPKGMPFPPGGLKPPKPDAREKKPLPRHPKPVEVARFTLPTVFDQVNRS
jgi:hypothetical protein